LTRDAASDVGAILVSRAEMKTDDYSAAVRSGQSPSKDRRRSHANSHDG
jgi:hypothetical protein